MTKRTQVHLASLAVGVALLLTSAFLLMVFYVPSLEFIWESSDIAISSGQQWLLSISRFCRFNGIVMVPALAGLLIAAVGWRIVAQVQFAKSRDKPAASPEA